MFFEDVYKKEGEAFISTWFYDRIAYGLLKFTKQLPITPNQITILSFVMAIISAYLFYIDCIMFASIFMVMFFVLDCLDGMTARIKVLTSSFGDYLDHTFGTIFIYLIYFAIAWNLESKILAYLLLFSVVLYNYGVGSTVKNKEVEKARKAFSKIRPSYIGFGFDIQSFIMLIGALTGNFIFSLCVVTLGCLSFSMARLIIATMGAKNG